eukprot:11980548-Alexandrium_andersonii.AAC.1
MSASLVGSEMCIRDRASGPALAAARGGWAQSCAPQQPLGSLELLLELRDRLPQRHHLGLQLLVVVARLVVGLPQLP